MLERKGVVNIRCGIKLNLHTVHYGYRRHDLNKNRNIIIIHLH